ncbi:MAG: 2-succinyl-5-enolpyruvyl-6-hydroxy-3-cyclohexene-1-carboxylic-acid synthase [Nitriliruptorales bacterium]|nr:2-succinyl-5-enolpyruvyl-6-hydroxy-3-cyclohexene-1-carboxylic-acid synthase [Nitriliruptorales bacterium]
MSAPNPSTAFARVLVDEWTRCGVTDVVVAPGSRSTALVLAVADRDDLRTHVHIDERSAGFLAVGLARRSGRPALVVTTSGTATTNLHPAVVEADRSAVPLLVVTSDRPPELRDTDANQTIRQSGLYGGAVRWQVDLGIAEDRREAVAYWRSTADRAHAEATGLGGAAGPVHVNVPFREPTVPESDDGRSTAAPFHHALDGRPDGRPWVEVSLAPRVPDPALAGRLARHLGSVGRGLIVTGEGGPGPDALHRLAEVLRWPVVAEPLSGARDREGVIATHHHLLASESFTEEHRPELILRFGRGGLSRNLMRLLGADTPQVAVLADRRWSDPQRAATEIVVADPTLLCGALSAQLDPATDDAWRSAWREADRRASDAIEEALTDGELSEPAAVRAATRATPDQTALVVASSMPVRDLDAFMVPRSGLTIHGNRGASGIDGFVSTTLGVALAHEGPTLALAGDLSILHDSNGFLLDAGGDVGDVTFVVLNNDGGGIFHFLPQASEDEHFERIFGTPHGRSFADLAAFHRIGYQLVTDRKEFEDLVAEPDGRRLLEVRTDRAANVELHRRIVDAVAAALSSP